MFDLDAIRKRAQQASEHAADSIRQTMEKSEALTVGAKAEAEASASAMEAEGQVNAGSQRQVEILGQTFDPANLAQMAAGQELLRESVQKQAAAAAVQAGGTQGFPVWTNISVLQPIIGKRIPLEFCLGAVISGLRADKEIYA